jgi:membrane-anchored mycosin MYCP
MTAGRLVAVGVLLAVFAPQSAAAAAQCATPAGVYRDGVGWAQRLTDPARIWPLTNGAGQLVAVLGTGVDAGNAQFAAGQVVPGSDGTDCDGRGTFAAGIVAARPDPTTTFTGMAPGAAVLGVRYTETMTSGTGGDGPDPDALAEAITRAVTAGAGVVLVVVPSRRDSPALGLAVRDAVARGAVVVSPATGDQPGMRSYPTSLPGVVGVGAHDRAGAPVQQESGDHVAVAAPGDGLVSTAPGTAGRPGHRWGVKEPAFAAAYVAGAVALMRAYRPELAPAQVLARLTATANRPPGGGRDPRLGWGVVDVPAAVSAELPEVSQVTAPPTTVAPAAGPVPPAPRPRLPGVLALLGLAAAALAAVTAMVTTRARSADR